MKDVKTTKRSDKKKTIAKVTKSLINEPIQSARELAKKTWLWVSTVNRARKELAQLGTKDDRILWICDTDLENVLLWQRELQRRLKEDPQLLRTSDIVQIIAEWTKRYSLFKWDITDKDWWLKQIESVNIIIWNQDNK